MQLRRCRPANARKNKSQIIYNFNLILLVIVFYFRFTWCLFVIVIYVLILKKKLWFKRYNEKCTFSCMLIFSMLSQVSKLMEGFKFEYVSEEWKMTIIWYKFFNCASTFQSEWKLHNSPFMKMKMSVELIIKEIGKYVTVLFVSGFSNIPKQTSNLF